MEAPQTDRRIGDRGWRGWLAAACSADDRRVDMINLGGLVAIVGAVFILGWDVMFNKHEAGIFAFGGGVAAILGAMGGGKMVRDKMELKMGTGNGNGNGKSNA